MSTANLKSFITQAVKCLVLGCGYAASTLAQAPDQVLADFHLPAPARADLSAPLQLWATHYHVHKAAAVRKGVFLLAKDGTRLGPRLTRHDWCQAALEGTVRVKYNKGYRVFNFDGTGSQPQVNCAKAFPALPQPLLRAMSKSRFRVADGDFGDGIGRYQLQPFRSIAVDPKSIPYGSLIYIPEARGVRFYFQNKEYTHDGYFFAADTGGAIRDRHVDIFTGDQARNPFEFVASRSTDHFKAYLVWDAPLRRRFISQHSDS